MNDKQRKYNRASYLRHKDDPVWVAKRRAKTAKWRKKNKARIAKYQSTHKAKLAANPRYHAKQKAKKRAQYKAKMKNPAYKKHILNRNKAWLKSEAGRKAMARYLVTPKRKYNLYKSSAKRRGFVFRLTMEQFMTYWKKPCAYCGAPIDTIGLDRIDSKRGYTAGNLNPCCPECNRAKSDHTLKQYLDHCKRVASFNK